MHHIGGGPPSTVSALSMFGDALNAAVTIVAVVVIILSAYTFVQNKKAY